MKLDQIVSLASFVVEEAIKVEPAIAKLFQDAFSQGIPTEEDWAILRAGVASLDYATAVPDTGLTPEEIAQATALATASQAAPEPAGSPTTAPPPPAPPVAAQAAPPANVGGTLTKPPGHV